MDRARRNAPYLLLGAMLVAAGILLLSLTSGLTYFQDSWAVLMTRRDLGLDEILGPHNEHIAVGVTLVDIGLLNAFGMDSAQPEYVIHTVALLLAALLLFVYVKRRLGPWPALMATGLVVFLGPAWEVLLWSFELVFAAATACGIGMLLALERNDRRGDVLACVLLTLALAFSTLGVPFAVAAAVQVFIDRERHGLLRRAYVFVIPLVLFAIWYVGWGSDAESYFSLRNVLASPRFVVEAMSSAMGALFGLGASPYQGLDPFDPAWGVALLLAAVILVAVGQARRPGFSPGLWPVAAAAAANWLLTAFNYMPGRDPIASRYIYAGGFFLILIAANLLRGIRLGPRVLALAGVVVVGAISVNLVVLKYGEEWMRDQTEITRGDLAALEIASGSVDPDFQLTLDVAGTPSLINIYAANYLDAVAEHGSPAYSQDELAAAPPEIRRQADILLGQALPLSTVTRVGPVRRDGDCIRIAPGSGREVDVHPGSTTIAVKPGPPAQFSLRRFAEGEFPVSTEGAPGGSTTELTIPPDRSDRPWHLQVTAEQAAYVCTRSATGT